MVYEIPAINSCSKLSKKVLSGEKNLIYTKFTQCEYGAKSAN